jgi:hypothetical protein
MIDDGFCQHRESRTRLADGDNVEKAVEIALDVQQLTYESANLLTAASTLNRIGKH